MQVQAVLVALCVAGTLAQIPIPTKRPGFRYKQCMPCAQIQWEAFIDINCPDCQAAFPTLTQVAEYYHSNGGNVCLTIYPFPLPYHRNSFVGSQGAFVVDKATKGNSTYGWFQKVYDNLDHFNPYKTYNVTPIEIIRDYGILAQAYNIMGDDFQTAVMGDETHDDVVLNFKFGASRGVAGTPTFFVNGVNVNAPPTWTATQWKQLFDDLLKPGMKQSTCRAGTKKCEYLPGKVECCTPGEGCIPNVGCRC